MEPAPCAASDIRPDSSWPGLTNRVAILVNPTSGGHQKDAVGVIASKLRESGRPVEILETDRAGHMRELAREQDAGAILVAGGDGSINEAVQGLLERPLPRPVLGMIPQGTANVLRHELGLPASAAGVADMVLQNRVARLHLGSANGRPFVLMASAGFDAEVVKAVSKPLKERIGGLAYVLAAIRLRLTQDAADIEVNADDKFFVAKLVIVTKAKHYGGPFTIDGNISATEPGLSLIAVSDVGFLSLIEAGVRLLLGRLDGAKFVRRMPVRRVELRAPREVATQIDGDPLGSTPMTVCESGETLEVFVPAARRRDG